jgi:ribulose-phosphate 3-epimerase
MLDAQGLTECLIEVDGGVKLDNILQVFEAGVDVVVSGSGVFGTPDPADTLRKMRAICEGNGE